MPDKKAGRLGKNVVYQDSASGMGLLYIKKKNINGKIYRHFLTFEERENVVPYNSSKRKSSSKSKKSKRNPLKKGKTAELDVWRKAFLEHEGMTLRRKRFDAVNRSKKLLYKPDKAWFEDPSKSDVRGVDYPSGSKSKRRVSLVRYGTGVYRVPQYLVGKGKIFEKEYKGKQRPRKSYRRGSSRNIRKKSSKGMSYTPKRNSKGQFLPKKRNIVRIPLSKIPNYSKSIGK